MTPSLACLESYPIIDKTKQYVSVIVEHLAYFIVYLASLKKEYNAASRRNFWK